MIPYACIRSATYSKQGRWAGIWQTIGASATILMRMSEAIFNQGRCGGDIDRAARP